MKLILSLKRLERVRYTVTWLMHGLVEKEQAACFGVAELFDTIFS